VLIDYASMLRLLAEEQLAGRLTIAPRVGIWRLRGAHRLHPRAAATARGPPPYNVYAATATSGIAAECGRHQGLHLFEDLLITEVVDEHTRPASARLQRYAATTSTAGGVAATPMARGVPGVDPLSRPD
jgi:phenylacetate-coenzyme A ligase PaaK-like adenylate-forming protein